MKRLLPLLLPLAALLSLPAEAGETGNVKGKVTDSGGTPVPNAEVIVTGSNLAGEVAGTTGADGYFRFIALPPGQHEIIVSHAGFTPTRYVVSVTLDQTAFVPVVLKVASDTSEEIVVEEELPVIDTTRSAVSTSMTVELLQNVPTGRSYEAVTNMVPGVYGRIDTQDGGPSTGAASVRGEGQYGNNYYVDGISTRDPATKTSGTDVNFDAIEEIQVYTDGLPAEFGEATGMLVNVVTKDGGDEHHGTAAYFGDISASGAEYMILDVSQGMEVPTESRKFLNHELSLTAGGPLSKEKLWYFVAADLGRDVITFEGADPDYPYNDWAGDGFLKITWKPTSNVTFQHQNNFGYTDARNMETSGLFSPEAQRGQITLDLTTIETLRWHPSARSELEVKLSAWQSNLDSVPMSGDEETPSVKNLETSEVSGNFTDFDSNKRSRVGGSAKYTQMADGLGAHRIKAGADYWILKDSRELTYTGPDSGIQYWSAPESGFACTPEANYEDCYGYTEYEEVGALGHTGHIMGFFLQDDWEVVKPLTINVGARLDRETLYQNEGMKIVDSWMPQPRLGAAWDVTGDSKTKLTFNLGRYYDLSGNTFADWGDTRSAYVYRQYEDTDGDPSTWGYTNTWTQDPATDPLIYCNQFSIDSLRETDPAAADAAEAACEEYGWLKPYHMDKIVLGVEREIIPLLAIGLKGIASATRDLPEDIDYDANTWIITSPESKRRDYRAVELTLEKKSDGVWQALASYTFSSSKGTAPGQFETSSGSDIGSNGNEVGVYLDDVNDPDSREWYYQNGYDWLVDGLAGLGTVDDDAGWYGYLPYHSFHIVKVSGSYTAPWGTTLGAVYEFDSGHAWQKRGYVDLYYDFSGFPEGRGTRFMPPVHYFDVRVAHAFKWREGKRSVEISADVFNVLDLSAPITYYENDTELFGMTMYRQSPRAVRAGLKYTY